MSEQTKIAWADSTWNPWRGCDKVSPGCKNCYITSTMPFRTTGQKHGDPRVLASEAIWKAPFKWNRQPWVCEACGKAWAIPGMHPDCDAEPYQMHRRRVFSLSLGDWLDPKVPIAWLARMLDTIRQCDQIDWLLVTKRPELWSKRLREVLDWTWKTECPKRYAVDGRFQYWLSGWHCRNEIPKNVWIIASAENQEMADKRVPELLRIPAVVRGLSCEPLLGLIDLSETKGYWGGIGLNWVIVGGESGKNARPCNIHHIYSLRDQCQAAKVPVFIKQMGSNPVDDISRLYFAHTKGGDPSEWPADLRVQQFPK